MIAEKQYKMDYKDLEKLGLNRNESKVYLGLIKLGNATAAELVKQIGAHRNIIYDNLEKLIEKGLVSYVIQNAKKVFIAQEPQTIFEFLEKKKEDLEKEIEIAKELVPQVTSLMGSSQTKQEAQILRGVWGMKKALAKTLESKEILVLGMTNNSTELLGETYWKNYNAKIKARKITEKLLVNSDFKDTYSFEKNMKIKKKKLPKELNQSTETIIFNDNIAIFVYSNNPLVFLIKDKTLSESYKIQFEYLWKSASE